VAGDGALRIKLQLFCGNERALGPGRADVLEAIDRVGSISGAGRALGMSYRYTWLLVDGMNRCFEDRVVETATGGTGRGGARLTDTGRAVLSAYRALEEDLRRASEGEALAALRALLRPEPLPRG
jgi:molybdate transport system regulatory protein